MPRRKTVPKYSLHKPSGRARVVIAGKQVYLGVYGSPESRERYLQFIASSTRTGNEPVVAGVDAHRAVGVTAYGGVAAADPNLTINELILRFLIFANKYYARNGKPTGEYANMRDSMRPVRALFSHGRAWDFGPKALKAIQQHMIDSEGLSRRVINSRINRIRRMFKWAVSEELVPAPVFQALCTVAGLKYGRTTARETSPVTPVDDRWVDATLPFLAPQIADMVRVQRLTGARPADVTMMRWQDIDRTGDVWIYRPMDHKTRYLGHDRAVAIGPQAQTILQKYLDRLPTVHIFSPAEAEAWRRNERAKLPSKRRTKVYPSELKKRDRIKALRAKRRRCRPPAARYVTPSYYMAVQYGIRKAAKSGVIIPAWFPNQLRHSRATEVRRDHGIEAAQVVLGHAKADVTQVYAERNLELAKSVARKTG